MQKSLDFGPESLQEFKDNFIITFKDSSTRPEIFKGYLGMVKK